MSSVAVEKLFQRLGRGKKIYIRGDVTNELCWHAGGKESESQGRDPGRQVQQRAAVMFAL